MNTSIAINQLNPLANQPAKNFEVMQKTIAQNTANGSVLSIFPEDFLYGVLRDQNDLANASKRFEQWVCEFRNLAIRYQTDLIPGTLPSPRDGNVYNTAVYIDKSGKVLTTYSKNNLWLSERDEYQSSLRLPEVFDGALGKMAIIICWDLLDHALFESAVRRGAEWVVILSFWSKNQSKDLAVKRGVVRNRYSGFSDSILIDNLVAARAAEYNIGIVFANFADTHKYMGSAGPQLAVSANRSQIVAPYATFRARLRNRKEATLACDVSSIKQAIRDFEILYGRRSDIVNFYPRSPHQA